MISCSDSAIGKKLGRHLLTLVNSRNPTVKHEAVREHHQDVTLHVGESRDFSRAYARLDFRDAHRVLHNPVGFSRRDKMVNEVVADTIIVEKNETETRQQHKNLE